MTVFDSYSRYYDLFNDAKNYEAEAEYVHGLISRAAPSAKRLLDLGCGTGGHAFPFLRLGYDVQGIDLSLPMIERASLRRDGLPPDEIGRIDFSQGDIRDFRSQQDVDAVVSLFHVISYQTTTTDLGKAFQTARAHLKPGGIFVFDCWYGPGVLSDPPYKRTRDYRSDRFTATRTSIPTVFPNENRVRVRFDFMVRTHDDKIVDEFTEQHDMRYLFAPEVDALLSQSKFQVIELYHWMTEEVPDLNSWNAVFVARAI